MRVLVVAAPMLGHALPLTPLALAIRRSWWCAGPGAMPPPDEVVPRLAALQR